jgi:hypothetical protein
MILQNDIELVGCIFVAAFALDEVMHNISSKPLCVIECDVYIHLFSILVCVIMAQLSHMCGVEFVSGVYVGFI